MRLVLGTQNPGKFLEIQEVLRDVPELELLSLRDLGISGDVLETGQTYEENSLLKARHYFDEVYRQTGEPIPVLGEDSGILVEALAEELGVFTRRWGAGEKASDEEWIRHFLRRLENEQNRRALFSTVATWFDGRSEPMVFRGETSGIITETLEAPIQAGIPISACFRPDGCEKVYSALSREEKNALSHRGKAMHALKAWLLEQGDDNTMET